MLTGNNHLFRSKVFEDFQGTFFKKFLEWGMGQRPTVHTPLNYRNQSPEKRGRQSSLRYRPARRHRQR